jgi:carbonic anhydrase
VYALAAVMATVAVSVVGPTAHSVELTRPKQSPINITAESVRADHPLPPLRIDYHHSDVTLTYKRKDADVPDGCVTRHREETEEADIVPGTAHVMLSGVQYDLVQFHFHTPSEHQLAGHSAPLEMHLVHRSAAGKLLVIGIPLLPGHPSTVDKVLDRLAPECGDTVHVGDIDLNSLLPLDRRSLRYDGSLTTAPFTEDVQWILMRDKQVSEATIARFKALFIDGNARSPQPLNGRILHVDLPRN